MFTPKCLPILIGSLPLTDHNEAMELILSHSPQIPLWPQLPMLPREGMVRQFITGFPGLQEDGGRFWIDTTVSDFEEQMASFYQDYLDAEAASVFPAQSRFALSDDTARGFQVFLDTMKDCRQPYVTLKGQITGPVTTGIGVKDQQNRSIIYDENLRDMLIKHLTCKACLQIEKLKELTGDTPPIIFIDEPGIVSFGSSSFVGISKEMVSEAVAEVVAGIQNAGGLAGIHICANGDWSPALSSAADIISFDAYFYFDNFILYKELLIDFLKRGGILAWGIVPTGDPAILEEVSGEYLFEKWQEQLEILSSFGFSHQQLMEQTFIAPACGTGSLQLELAVKVLQLTAEVSARARGLFEHCST
jgi:hypothetical protein